MGDTPVVPDLPRPSCFELKSSNALKLNLCKSFPFSNAGRDIAQVLKDRQQAKTDKQIAVAMDKYVRLRGTGLRSILFLDSAP